MITSEQIVDEAKRQLQTGGADALSMRALAKSLGTTPMALYRHVGDKEQLISAVLDVYSQDLGALVLPQDQVDRLLEVARTDPITIDLDNQIVTTPFQDRFAFDVDPFRKRCLLEGLDEIGLTLASGDAITHHEAGRAQDLPWLDCPLAVSR